MYSKTALCQGQVAGLAGPHLCWAHPASHAPTPLPLPRPHLESAVGVGGGRGRGGPPAERPRSARQGLMSQVGCTLSSSGTAPRRTAEPRAAATLRPPRIANLANCDRKTVLRGWGAARCREEQRPAGRPAPPRYAVMTSCDLTLNTAVQQISV